MKENSTNDCRITMIWYRKNIYDFFVQQTHTKMLLLLQYIWFCLLNATTINLFKVHSNFVISFLPKVLILDLVNAITIQQCKLNHCKFWQIFSQLTDVLCGLETNVFAFSNLLFLQYVIHCICIVHLQHKVSFKFSCLIFNVIITTLNLMLYLLYNTQFWKKKSYKILTHIWHLGFLSSTHHLTVIYLISNCHLTVI